MKGARGVEKYWALSQSGEVSQGSPTSSHEGAVAKGPEKALYPKPKASDKET